MKAKVIIQDGKSEISLTPENPFEESMMEDAYTHHKLEVSIDKTGLHGVYDYRMVVNLEKEKPTQPTR